MLHIKFCKPCPVVLTAQFLVYFCKYEVCSLVLIHVNVKIGKNIPNVIIVIFWKYTDCIDLEAMHCTLQWNQNGRKKYVQDMSTFGVEMCQQLIN